MRLDVFWIVLQVYKGPTHPHEAQAPKDITHMINYKPGAKPA